jgi:hydrogenase nickel incorporation protein HypB
MCSVCGCGEAQIVLEQDKPAGGHAHAADHAHPHDHDHGHDHDHDHHHDHGPHHHDEGVIDYGQGPAGAHAPGVSQERMVAIERDILSMNDAYARDNRRALAAKGVFALNFVSSPGSGKTALLARTIEALKGRLAVSVIEGDQQTSNDAERIRATGAPAIQINTGKGCHLDAHMVGHAIETLDPEPNSTLFIENVGNLVCPAGFDLGEAHKVVVLSVTEGEDKPLKYPDMFVAADLLLLNKSDLLPHLDFDVGLCLANALRINPHLQTLVVSAKTGEGLAAFVAWIEASAARRAAALAKG